jgi:hypothetical protein
MEGEPPARFRQFGLPETMADEDGNDGSMWSACAFTLDTAPRPRSIGGTRPGRISSVRNVETPMESGGGRYAGGPTVREAESSSGNRNVQEANAGSRKATGIHNRPDRAIPNPKGC